MVAATRHRTAWLHAFPPRTRDARRRGDGGGHMEPNRPAWRARAANPHEKTCAACRLGARRASQGLMRARSRFEFGEQRQYDFALDRDADGRERAAMMAGNAQPANPLAMFGCRVPDIGFPAVSRITRRQSAHDPIARDLGDDRSSRDRKAESIALNNGPHCATQRRRGIAIDECRIRSNPEDGDSARHRQQRCAQNVDAIDLEDARRADPDAGDPATRATLERLVARLALLDGQCFRIVELIAQPPWEVAGVEDHRSRENRTRERAAPRLVHATNQPLAAALDLEIRHRASPSASATTVEVEQ